MNKSNISIKWLNVKLLLPLCFDEINSKNDRKNKTVELCENKVTGILWI